MAILDGFTGTAVMAQKFKSYGLETSACDHLRFCYALADCHLSLNEQPTFPNLNIGQPVLEFLNQLEGQADFITTNYSPFDGNSRMYLTIENAMKVDAVRIQIEDWKEKNLLSSHEFNYLLATLLYAINLVSNITGTYGAYLKFWEGRATKQLKLQEIKVFNNGKINQAHNLDIQDVITKGFDFIYLDPPYNSRSYFSNYFLLEIVAKGWFEHKPIPEGQTGIPKNLSVKSEFTSKQNAIRAFHNVLSKAEAKVCAISYNNEGIVSQEKLVEVLQNYGKTEVYEVEHKRYRSINQTGQVNKTKELLFTVRKKNG
jgi:adenine-specific DNA-methyltransferase